MTIVLFRNILLWFTENEPQLHSYHINKQYDKVLFESFENRRSQYLHERLRLYILTKITHLWQVLVLALIRDSFKKKKLMEFSIQGLDPASQHS